MVSSTWWHIPALVGTIAILGFALVQFTVEPESVRKKRHAMYLLQEVQSIADAVLDRLNTLEGDINSHVKIDKADESNDASLNSYYHFDSNGKKLKTKWDSFDIDAELKRLDEDEDSNTNTSPSPAKKYTKNQLLRRVAEMEHEFESILSYLDTIRGDDEVRIVRKQIVGSINDTYLPRLDQLKANLE